jgi:hypothetical protein
VRHEASEDRLGRKETTAERAGLIKEETLDILKDQSSDRVEMD